MSSRRNSDHNLSERELRALLQLLMLRVPGDVTLNELLPDHAATDLVHQFCPDTINETIERRIRLAVEELQRSGTQVIKIGDVDYPESLARLAELRPPVLFCRGKTELLHSKIVAVVGTRRSTEYGNAAAEMIAHDLADHGITVISGLALGIDTHAHLGAFAAEGNTIAILGCGIDVFYPHRNQRLQERIATEGLLISEFAPGAPAVKHHFLQRNRLIALLARAVVVVEAGRKSGTNNTVKWALDYGVDVFAVPGPIGREASVGTNALIQDGAKLVTCSLDILQQLPWKIEAPRPAGSRPPAPIPLQPTEARIYDALGPVALQIDQIARTARLDTATALALLAHLELTGLVRQLPGKRFMRAELRTVSAKQGTA
jgi:DNA processing protein